MAGCAAAAGYPVQARTPGHWPKKPPCLLAAIPLPAPNCGWLLVREASFLDGIPPCTTQRDAWQLALTAQAAGYYAAAFETAAQAAARADVLDVYEADAAPPPAVAKHLGGSTSTTAKVKGRRAIKKQQPFYLDLVRAVALICILVVHFNATVTGYFTLPHKIFTSNLPLGHLLGGFRLLAVFYRVRRVTGADSPGRVLQKAGKSCLSAVLARVVRCVQLPVRHAPRQFRRGQDP